LDQAAFSKDRLQTMTRTLAVARAEFIKALTRDTGGSDRPRFIAVLDALIAWSVAHPDQLSFRIEESQQAVVSFERTTSKVVFWTAHPRREGNPKLELLPRAATLLTDEQRAATMEAINAHTSDPLLEDEKLRIGFGALKNTAGRTAILALMEGLLLVT
jgi:hypothetical protein